MSAEAIVEMRAISKTFPGVRALDQVDFSLQRGSIHGLVGENGAGKSTLMKILSGAYTGYEGDVFLNGQNIRFKNERDALEHGIAIVAQELTPIPQMTVAENVFINREPHGKIKWLIDRKARDEMAQRHLKELGLDVRPDQKMGELTVAQCQLVEIAKATSRGAQVIILDEPTSALTNIEIRQFFNQVIRLRDEGVALVYISHKLEEVFELCDHITVLCDGKLVGSRPADEFSTQQLITMMVGRTVDQIYPHLEPVPANAPEVLRVEGLTDGNKYEDISFTLRAGEVLGFAGMMGAGRSEVMRGIFGLDRRSAGQVRIDGKDLSSGNARHAINAGICMVTEDRAIHGFVGQRTIRDNIALPNMDLFAAHMVLNERLLDKSSAEICARLHVKAPSVHALVQNLSGGNQQKVVLAKWMVRNMRVLIMDEPTRGIDVGAKQEIYQLINTLAQNGLGILLVSSEMPEVIAMSHRICVMSSGRIVQEFSRAEVTQDLIMEAIVKGR